MDRIQTNQLAMNNLGIPPLAAYGQLRHLSDQEEWWSPFMERIRQLSDK